MGQSKPGHGHLWEVGWGQQGVVTTVPLWLASTRQEHLTWATESPKTVRGLKECLNRKFEAQ